MVFPVVYSREEAVVVDESLLVRWSTSSTIINGISEVVDTLVVTFSVDVVVDLKGSEPLGISLDGTKVHGKIW